MTKVIRQDTFNGVAVGVGAQSPDLGIVITFTGIATCSSGNVSATFQLEGSNTGNANEWHVVGAPVTISAGASPQIANGTRVQFAFAQYRINCTALTCTGAQLVTQIAVGS